MDPHKQPEKDVNTHDNALHELALLNLRGTFVCLKHHEPPLESLGCIHQQR